MKDDFLSDVMHEIAVLKGVSLGAEKLAESFGGDLLAVGTGGDEHEALCATLSVITDKLRALSERLSDYELRELQPA